MKQNFENAIAILKEQTDVDGCITGSCWLGFNEGWNQDIEVFCYNKSSFNQLIYFMKYNPMFTILDPLELHKMNDYIKNDRSSLKSIGLITIKFKYNLCVDVNVIFKEFHKTIFDVLSNFDLDLIATGYDIKTGKMLSLRETEGFDGTWNRWNTSFYKTDYWSTKRLLRQFERVVKYTERGYDLSSVTDKYISIVEEILEIDNIYKTEKGTKFYNDTMDQFEVVLKILKAWKKELKMSPEELKILKTII